MTAGSRSSAEPSSGAPAGPPEPVLAAIENHLKERERRRDELATHARRLRRLAQVTMGRLHASGSTPSTLAEVRERLGELERELKAGPPGDEGVALDAVQEAVEAILLGAVLDRRAWPGPGELGVEPEAYLLGLGDVVGEVRRLALDSLGREDLPSAEAYLRLMEGLCEALLRFDTTRAIVQLKPKQDQARILLERTRGEVVMARYLLRARGGANAREPP
jgi:translin